MANVKMTTSVLAGWEQDLHPPEGARPGQEGRLDWWARPLPTPPNQRAQSLGKSFPLTSFLTLKLGPVNPFPWGRGAN